MSSPADEEAPPATSRGGRPRDAASIVIVRERAAGPEVLLGRREPRHRFMPNVWVFPGGRVDRDDGLRPVERPLQPDVERLMGAHAAPNRAQALAVAAVRETWEEAGLVYGQHSDTGLAPDLHGLQYLARAITPAGNPIRYHARFFLAHADAASGELVGNGELLDLAWTPIPEALELPIIDVTTFVLQHALRRLSGEESRALFVRYRRGEPHLQLEG